MLYGTVEVVSSPIGANIIIDGNDFGITPSVLTNVLVGTHELRLVKEGYYVTTKSINLDNKNRLSVNEKLEKIGAFSVSDTKKVSFANGNLQYQASTNTWRFAENQWDMIGDNNKNISSSYSGWIDLFGYGTGNNPTNSSLNYSDYSSFNDWGNNSISNGEGNNWFTLTNNEWAYVLHTRSTNSGIRFAKATVNGVKGVVLLPDNWNSSNYSLSDTNTWNARFRSNHISQDDWTSIFEVNGAVFLPAAGHRSGTSVLKVGSCGRYWSATYKDSDNAYSVFFNFDNIGTNWYYRRRGQSVRLVTLVE